MDERQTKIRHGAGLEEARINTELIDFLNKWSSPVLILIGLVGLGWFGYNYLHRTRMAERDNAFAAFESAVSMGNPSPASLRNIASEYGGIGSVGELALLQTTDIYLRAAIAGVEPGAEVDPATGRPLNDEDVLTPEEVLGYLSQARDLAREVVGSTENDADRVLLFVQALMRVGAAEAGLGEIDAAKAAYRRAGEAARGAGFPGLGAVADEMLARADAAAGPIALPSRDELPELPGEAAFTEPGDLPMNFDELLSMPGLLEALSGEGGEAPAEPDAAPADQPQDQPADQPGTEPAQPGDDPRP